MHNLNLTLFYFIYNFAGKSSVLDSVVVFITTYLAYIVVIGVSIFIAVWLPLRTRDALLRLKRLGRGGELLLTLSLTLIATSIVKVVVAHPRPFATLVDITPLVHIAKYESFPSGHAALTMALATFVYLHYRRLGALLLIFSLVVGISRLYVGVHYPVDIIAGFLLGYGIARCAHVLCTISIATPDRPVVK